MTNTQLTIKTVVQQYNKKKKNLLPVLQEVVKTQNYLTENSINQIAEEMGISPAEIFGIASFYSFLDIKPRAENIIRICKSISCDMNGKDEIIKALEDTLKIKCGETTQDKKFTIVKTNCIGWCHKGPAMLVNDDIYTELTPEKAREIINTYLDK